MAAWTPDSELAPLPVQHTPRIPRPVKLVAISVAISVPLTIAVLYAIVQLAFHFCWGCAGN